MFSLESIFDSLNDKQREICHSPANYLLKACPGSGKTRTITHRIAYICATNSASSKLNIAITYTNRAAIEIEDRLENLNIDMSTVWAGTIHQFCMKYIIRPYSMYSERLRYGYSIIDEYRQKEYAQEIALSLGIKVGYKPPLSFEEIRQQYERKLESRREIDFQQILEYSYELLHENRFIAENISSIIRSIHVDEYQDTNELQYRILAEIIKCNKAINISFVGDENQAIFKSLGGVAKSKTELEDMFDTQFIEDQLSGCYRSTTRVIDYYSHFSICPSVVSSMYGHADNSGYIVYNKHVERDKLPSLIAAIIKSQLDAGIPENDICIVAPQWNLVFDVANKLRRLLPNVRFDAPDITPFKYDPMNPFYWMAELFFSTSGARSARRKRKANDVLAIIRDEYRVQIYDEYDALDLLRTLNTASRNIENGFVSFQNAVLRALKTMGIDLEQEQSLLDLYNGFISKAQRRIQSYNIDISFDGLVKCFKNKEGIVMNVIHGIKGEEYHTVIGYGLLNGYLPHWEYIMDQKLKSERRNETMHLLYVLCSRAKENLFLFSETGRKTQRGSTYSATDELQFVYGRYNALSSVFSSE